VPCRQTKIRIIINCVNVEKLMTLKKFFNIVLFLIWMEVKPILRLAFSNQQDWLRLVSGIAERKVWCCGYCLYNFVHFYVIMIVMVISYNGYQ
jgi:hypothetical protein